MAGKETFYQGGIMKMLYVRGQVDPLSRLMKLIVMKLADYDFALFTYCHNPDEVNKQFRVVALRGRDRSPALDQGLVDLGLERLEEEADIAFFSGFEEMWPIALISGARKYFIKQGVEVEIMKLGA